MADRAALAGGVKNADAAQAAGGQLAGLREAIRSSGTPASAGANMLAAGHIADAGFADQAAGKLDAAAAGQNSWREAVLGIAGPGMGVAQNQAGSTIRGMLDSTNSQVSKLGQTTQNYVNQKTAAANGLSSLISGAGSLTAGKIQQNRMQNTMNDYQDQQMLNWTRSNPRPQRQYDASSGLAVDY
jgi:hypothetical protein